jgi:predicted type IV restriction endonuclease
MKITKKTEDRLISLIPKFQKVLAIAKARDLNESDTVAVITDVLAEVFGYEKYLEITSEMAIRGTYCDLAVKIGDKIQFLIECKAIGTELKEMHLRQAIGYGSNKGLPWIVLTNGADWQIYRIRFEQPIAWDLVARFDLSIGNPKDEKFIEALFLMTKEGVEKSAREEVYEKNQCVNRFVIGAIIMSDPVVQAIKREVRRFSDGLKIEETEIVALLNEGVLRRDLVEGDEALAAQTKVAKMNKQPPPLRKTAPKQESPKTDSKSISVTDQLLAVAPSVSTEKV